MSPLPDTLPVIHIGLHKTATSWLQAHIFDNAPDSQILAFKDYLHTIEALLIPDEAEFDPDKARKAFAPFLEDARARNKIPVITSEELGGLPFHKRFHRTATAQRLAKTFPEAKILITIREQAAVILSVYGQFVRYGYVASLPELLAEPPPGTGYQSILEYPYYDYDWLLNQYEDLFGVGNVVMAPYEAFTKDPGWLTERLGTAVGRTIETPRIDLSQKRVNVADAAHTRYLIRQLNRFITRDLRWDPKKRWLSPNGIGARFNRLVPKSWAATAKKKDLETVRSAIGNRYDASNARLAARLGVDLGALGYRVSDPA